MSLYERVSPIHVVKLGQLTLLHLRDQLLVEETSGLLMQRAVDGDYIALAQHLLKRFHASASDFFFDLGFERLVVKVQQFLAVERFESAQNTFTDTAHSHCANSLALEIKFVLRGRGNIPLSRLDLLVRGDEVADESEDGHDDVFCHGDNVGAGDFRDGNSSIGIVGCVEVDVVRADSSCYGELEFLGFLESLRSEVTWMESVTRARRQSVPTG